MSGDGALAQERVTVGQSIPEICIAITLQRLVMEAGANRDFSLIHHDRQIAVSTGASDAFANTFFLMGMFERSVREWLGPRAMIRKIGPLRMMNFNTVGDTLYFRGEVTGVQQGSQETLLDLLLWCDSERGRTTTCEVRVQCD